ncbi:MAG: hypothetical protein ABII00_12965 [Elusimicrobiota bacterium]
MRYLSAALAGFVLAHMAARAQAEPEPPGFTPEHVRAAQRDPRYFTLDPESIEVVKLSQASPGRIAPKAPAIPPQSPVVVIERIVNIARTVWKIIEENKPVVDVETCFATALPEGVAHWDQLSGWRPPEGAVYGLRAENLYGVKVIDLRFQVLRTHGGSYKGKGKYLHAVMIEPLKIEVAWGYRFGMKAEVPSVVNVGTAEDPVAGMIARLGWSIDTVLKHSEGKNVFYLQGDGVFRELGGPFKKPALASGARALGKARRTVLSLNLSR